MRNCFFYRSLKFQVVWLSIRRGFYSHVKTLQTDRQKDKKYHTRVNNAKILAKISSSGKWTGIAWHRADIVTTAGKTNTFNLIVYSPPWTLVQQTKFEAV